MRMRMRRAKRRKVWLEGVTPAGGGTGNFFAASQTPGTFAIPVLSSTQIETSLDGDGGLLRIVGDLWLQRLIPAAGGVANAMCSMGLMLMQEDQTGAVSTALSPINTVGQEFKWLWTSNYLFAAGVASNNYYQPSVGGWDNLAGQPSTPAKLDHRANIDIGVRRRVRTGTPIILYVDTHLLPANNTWNLYGSLRVLCSH